MEHYGHNHCPIDLSQRTTGSILDGALAGSVDERPYVRSVHDGFSRQVYPEYRSLGFAW